MNKPVSPLEAAMLALRAACPPTGVIHIGAGHGRGVVHAWRAWDVEDAVLVEADAARFGWAQELASQLPGWHAIEAVVAASEHDVVYYSATNPDEDGLVQPELLAQLWPNLRSVRNEKKAALTLDSLVTPLPHAKRLNWLLIDCFGAEHILGGGSEALRHADVVVLRSVRNTQAGTLANSEYEQQASLARAAGLEPLPFFEATHPLLGHAIFVRQVANVIQARQNQLTEAERTARNSAKALTSRIAELETIHRRALDDLNQQLAGAEAEKKTLVEERDLLLLAAGKRKKELAHINEHNASLEAALTTSQEKLAQCAQSQRTAQTGQRAAETSLGKTNAALAAANEELQVLRGTLDHSGAQLAQALAALADAERLRDSQAADILALRAETERLGTSAVQLTTDLDVLSSKHAALQAALDSAATAHRVDMDAARGDLEEQRQQLEQGAQAISALKAERDVLVQAAAKRKARISELEQAMQDLTDKLAQQAQLHSAVEQELKAQQARAAQSEQAKAKLARELEELRPASQALQEQADRLTRQLSESKTRSTQAEAEFASKLGRMEELESENQRARHQHSLLQDELIKGEAQIELIKDLLLRDAGL